MRPTRRVTLRSRRGFWIDRLRPGPAKYPARKSPARVTMGRPINTTAVSSMRVTGATFTIRFLMTTLVLLLGDVNRTHAQEPYFPELVFLPKDKDVNSIIDGMTSVHLKAMRERSLWKLSQRDRTANVYRFLWLASGEHPICIRFTRTGGAFVLHVAGHEVSGPM
jgi:hypothetical protein